MTSPRRSFRRGLLFLWPHRQDRMCVFCRRDVSGHNPRADHCGNVVLDRCTYRLLTHIPCSAGVASRTNFSGRTTRFFGQGGKPVAVQVVERFRRGKAIPPITSHLKSGQMLQSALGDRITYSAKLSVTSLVANFRGSTNAFVRVARFEGMVRPNIQVVQTVSGSTFQAIFICNQKFVDRRSRRWISTSSSSASRTWFYILNHNSSPLCGQEF